MRQSDFIELALPLWDFLAVSDKPKVSDAIFAFGGSDVLIARTAAQLYSEGYSKILLATGASGPLSKDRVATTEAEMFAAEAMRLGVPEEDILIEPTATNTGQNVEFGMKLLTDKKIASESVSLVAKPFLMRRCIATFAKQFPQIATTPCCPAGGPFIHQDRALDVFALRLVQEVERLKNYAIQGFIVEQDIPEHIEAHCKKITDWISTHTR